MTMQEIYEKLVLTMKIEAKKTEWNITAIGLQFYNNFSKAIMNDSSREIDLDGYSDEWNAVNRLALFYSLVDIKKWKTNAIGSLFIKNQAKFVGKCQTTDDYFLTERKQECQSFIDMLDEFFTIPGEKVSLPDIAYMFSAKDPRTIISESFNQLDPDLKTCLQNISNEYFMKYEDQLLENIEDLDDETIEYFKSPCNEVHQYPQCEDYCTWHKELFTKLSKREFLAIMKYALPQRKLLLDDTSLEERNLAKKLFGGENVMKKVQYKSSTMTNVVYICHQMDIGLTGDTLSNGSLKACNKFFLNPSDVGLCLTKNVNIKENVNFDQDLDIVLDSNLQKPVANIEGGNLWTKKTIVIVPDRDSYQGFSDVNWYMKQAYKRDEDDNLEEFLFNLHPKEEFAKMVHGYTSSKHAFPMKLKFGHSYFIEVTPKGDLTTKAFKNLNLSDRKCFLKSEGLEASYFKTYNQNNCYYECYGNLASEFCKCNPWDYLTKPERNHSKECDIFGRRCFYKTLKKFARAKWNHCKECLKACDFWEYSKNVKEVKNSFLEVLDKNKALKDMLNVLSNQMLDEGFHQIYNSTTISYGSTTYYSELYPKFTQPIIIELTFWKPEVQVTDVKYTTFDKFANFGGNFGIFAEITGCSFLGMMNFFILLLKILLCCCKNINEGLA